MSYTAHCSQVPIPFGMRPPDPPTQHWVSLWSLQHLALVIELSFSVTNVVYDIAVRGLHLVVSCARFIY